MSGRSLLRGVATAVAVGLAFVVAELTLMKAGMSFGLGLTCVAGIGLCLMAAVVRSSPRRAIEYGGSLIGLGSIVAYAGQQGWALIPSGHPHGLDGLLELVVGLGGVGVGVFALVVRGLVTRGPWGSRGRDGVASSSE